MLQELLQQLRVAAEDREHLSTRPRLAHQLFLQRASRLRGCGGQFRRRHPATDAQTNLVLEERLVLPLVFRRCSGPHVRESKTLLLVSVLERNDIGGTCLVTLACGSPSRGCRRPPLLRLSLLAAEVVADPPCEAVLLAGPGLVLVGPGLVVGVQ